MNIDDGVLTTCVIQDALGRCGFTGVDVGDDPDVADIRQWGSAGQSNIP